MDDPLPIAPLAAPPDTTVTVPGSKSITNRALVLAALARGVSTIEGALFSDDTGYMAAALRRLGLSVQEDEAAERFNVAGGAGSFPARAADLFVGNAGTAARFLTAFLTLGHGRYRLDGAPRMRQRPIEPLLDALRQLGVRATDQAGNGCPPVVVEADGFRGGSARVRADASSQYVSALLLVAPASVEGVTLELEGPVSSEPYIDMTLRMLGQWGADVVRHDARRLTVPGGQRLEGRQYLVEPDASAASYFWAAAAVTGGRVRVCGLGRHSLQGDSAFVDVLRRMGCRVRRGARWIEVRGPARLRGVDIDMNAISDTVMTLAAIAPFASSPTTIRNVAHVRVKESDRLTGLWTELRRLGVEATLSDDGIVVQPADALLPATVETYDDHRMAMSFAVTALRSPGISIRDPACVAKTFPGFFDRLDGLRRPDPL